MNHKFKNWVIRSNTRVEIINFLYKRYNLKSFTKEIERRKHLSIFDYHDLVKPLPYVPIELVIDNNLYGIAYALKKYANINIYKSLNAYIEHGIFFGNLVREDQKIWNVTQNITFSDVRRKHLENSGIHKNIVTIGPIIHYAEPLLSHNEFNNIKQQLGRVLLVFPSHSIIGVDANFSHDDFINEIEHIKKDFDTVLISLYWVDVLKPQIVNMYENMGYKIVTSGHRYDLYFLSRQRSLIDLADMTMSNSVGTHVGYCIYLNKPHYIYQQAIKAVGINKKLQQHFDVVRNNEQLLSEEIEKTEISQLFSQYQEYISTEQKEIIDKYWGCSLVKTPHELHDELQIR